MQANMLTEILEQPQIIGNLLENFICENEIIKNLEFSITDEQVNNISKIYIAASGSSRNVANIAKYFLSTYTKLPVYVDYASEFAHRDPPLKTRDIFIAISQSGKTADTYEALKVAKDKGAITLAITNNQESKIHTLADYKMYINAGEEKSIAATKSLTAQLLCLYIFGLYLAKRRGTLSLEDLKSKIADLKKLPEIIKEIFEHTENIKNIAKNINQAKSMVLLGRGLNYAVAREGALKIKETCYIDSNGYPSGEFLHGHLAFVDETVPIISIITAKGENEKNYQLAIKNTEEIFTKRNPKLIIVTNEKDGEIAEKFTSASFIYIPKLSEFLSAFLAVISLQLLAYNVAISLNYDVDNPRSLTKAIISE